MKKISVILFMLIMVIGVVGYAARIENDYFKHSRQVPPLSGAALSESPQGAEPSTPLTPLTAAVLLGTGLVGMVIVKRK